MSVYTSVSKNEVEAFLSDYSIGNLSSYQGIENGITNTNYWLSTDSGVDYVLTIYEHHDTATLDYILGLQQYLAERGVSCSKPVSDNYARLYSSLKGKPAAIINRVSGGVLSQLGTVHCAQIGKELARFHTAGSCYPVHHTNPCGDHWRKVMQQKLSPLLSATDRNLLNEELDAYRVLQNLNLPSGPTHSDLFHDNCLFEGDNLSGIIDFDYACDEYFLYDIAVCLNDCCIELYGEINQALAYNLLQGYQSLRPLTMIELENLPLMLRVAATRFWLSRLYDRHFPLAGEMTFQKDPGQFRNILLLRRCNRETADYLPIQKRENI